MRLRRRLLEPRQGIRGEPGPRLCALRPHGESLCPGLAVQRPVDGRIQQGGIPTFRRVIPFEQMPDFPAFLHVGFHGRGKRAVVVHPLAVKFRPGVEHPVEVVVLPDVGRWLSRPVREIEEIRHPRLCRRAAVRCQCVDRGPLCLLLLAQDGVDAIKHGGFDAAVKVKIISHNGCDRSADERREWTGLEIRNR